MERKNERKPLGKLFLTIFSVVIFLVIVFLSYRPDRPVANIMPGTSSRPVFIVQIIRPRAGLPLGGLLPPHFFGLDSTLQFDSESPGVEIGTISKSLVELKSDNWELVLSLDEKGSVTSRTHVVFDLLFQDQVRRVKCSPGEMVNGNITLFATDQGSRLSGHFQIEMPQCDDFMTGKSLGWPPKPLVLRGSFDRLSINRGDEN